MAVCKDPRMTFLNDQGYNVLLLPRQGIVPLGIIGRDHDSKNWLGTLDEIWHSSSAVPTPGAPQAVAGMKGEKTSDLKASFGLQILANALSGMFGATSPSLDAAYSDAKTVQFTFHDVVSIQITPFAIGEFLGKGNLASGNPFVKRFFGGEKNVEALVVTEVLQSKSIGVIAKKDGGASLAVNVPAIQSTLGAKVNATSASTDNSEITYEGPTLLTFGFKVFGISRSNGEWQVHGVKPDGASSFGTGEDLGDPIVSDGELVELSFAKGAGA